MNLVFHISLLTLMCLSLANGKKNLQLDFMFVKSFVKYVERVKYINIYCDNPRRCHQLSILKSFKDTYLHHNMPFQIQTPSFNLINQSLELRENKNRPPFTGLHFLPNPVIINSSCPSCFNFIEVLNIQDENNVFLFKVKSPNENLSDIFSTSEVNLKSNIYVYYTINNIDFLVFELYKLHESLPITKKYFTTWNNFTGFDENNTLHKWERRSNLTGLNLRYSVAQDGQFVMRQT